jgi:hypothetical protein
MFGGYLLACVYISWPGSNRYMHASVTWHARRAPRRWSDTHSSPGFKDAARHEHDARPV